MWRKTLVVLAVSAVSWLLWLAPVVPAQVQEEGMTAEVELTFEEVRPADASIPHFPGIAVDNAWQMWVDRVTSLGNHDDEGLAIAKDTEGNVYSVGYIWNGTLGTDFFVKKYNLQGEEVWSDIYENAGNDTARSVCVYGSYVYVGGELRDGSHSEYGLIQYNKETGAMNWAQPYSLTANDFKAYGVAANSTGVYLTGEGWSVGLLPQPDIYTVAYNHSGDLLWQKQWPGTSVSYQDYASAITADGSAVYVVGGTEVVPVVGWNYIILKYQASTGTQLWEMTYDGPGVLSSYDFAWDVAKSGNYLFVTGESDGGINLGRDFATLKVDATTGAIIWAARYDYAGGNDCAAALAVYNNEIYVTGRSQSAIGDFDYATIKYNSNGDPVWSGEERRYNASGGYDAAHDIAVTQTGVFVAGESDGSGTGRDYATVAYTLNGDALWSARYDGPAPGAGLDRANALVVTSYNVYVTGGSTGNNTGLDIATLRYSYGPWIVVTNVGPDTLPPQGGTVQYTLTIGNRYSAPVSIDVKGIETKPNGSLVTLFTRWNVTIQPGDTLYRNLSLPVSAHAQPGGYEIVVQVSEMNTLPNQIYDEDGFSFVKLAQESGVGSEYLISKIEEIGSNPHQTGLPAECQLKQNYPNPFNPATTISFELRAASYVNLRVYDTAGCLVATLVNGWREAGDYEVVFDASNLPSGVYLYRLSAGEFEATGKMTLMK